MRPLLPDDVQRLLAGCGESDVGARDRAVMVMLLDTGPRSSELSALNLDDVDITEMRIRVLHGKGNKQRVVAFSPACRDELVRYLRLRGGDPGPLFCGTVGRSMLAPGVRLEANGLKHMMRRLSTKTGIAKVHPHRFRHTFATWAIQQGAREIDVQLMLGHSTPEIVRRYTASYNIEQAARRHARFSPLLLILGSRIS